MMHILLYSFLQPNGYFFFPSCGSLAGEWMFDLLSAAKDNMQGRVQEEELHKEEGKDMNQMLRFLF